MDSLFSYKVPIIGAIIQKQRFKSLYTFKRILVLQNKSGPTDMYSLIQFWQNKNMGENLSHLANQKKAGVPECKPDNLFIVHSRKEESSTFIYHQKIYQ